jgi:hypothetical protein
MEEKQPVIKDLPPAPWHCELWSEVIDMHRSRREALKWEQQRMERTKEEAKIARKKLAAIAQAQVVAVPAAAIGNGNSATGTLAQQNESQEEPQKERRWSMITDGSKSSHGSSRFDAEALLLLRAEGFGGAMFNSKQLLEFHEHLERLKDPSALKEPPKLEPVKPPRMSLADKVRANMFANTRFARKDAGKDGKIARLVDAAVVANGDAGNDYSALQALGYVDSLSDCSARSIGSQLLSTGRRVRNDN